MRKTTKIIIVSLISAIILLGIGYAAIQNITLNISGTAAANPNQANYKVMFAGTPEVSDNTLVTATITDEITATIDVNGLSNKGESVSVKYTVLNASTDLSADLALGTTNSNPEYFTITSRIDNTSLVAGDSTTVTVIIELTKTPIDNVEAEIGVTLESMPVQPGEEGSSELTNDFSQTPSELNEYGFYFDAPYSAIVDGEYTSIVFHEDGSAEAFNSGRTMEEPAPSGYFSYGSKKIFLDDGELNIFEDGRSISWTGYLFTLDTTLKKIPNDVYFDNNNDGHDYEYKYFPLELIDGDCYIYEDYLYCYYEDYDGWYINLCNNEIIEKNEMDIQLPYEISKDKTSYTPILENILEKPVVGAKTLFADCENMIESPKLPDTVEDVSGTYLNCKSMIKASNLSSNITTMTRTFEGCESLKEAPDIPNAVTRMIKTFEGCISLENVSAIPSGVYQMDETFKNCSSLKSTPVFSEGLEGMYKTFEDCTSLENISAIPSTVTAMQRTFAGCTALKGEIEVNTNYITTVSECFCNVDMSQITLTGFASKEILNRLGATGDNFAPIT